MLKVIVKVICLLLLLVSISGCLIGWEHDGWGRSGDGHGEHDGGGRHDNRR